MLFKLSQKHALIAHVIESIYVGLYYTLRYLSRTLKAKIKQSFESSVSNGKDFLRLNAKRHENN